MTDEVSLFAAAIARIEDQARRKLEHADAVLRYKYNQECERAEAIVGRVMKLGSRELKVVRRTHGGFVEVETGHGRIELFYDDLEPVEVSQK